MNVKEFELVNEEKVNRAIYGTQTSKGEMKGGVGEGEGEDWEAKVIAEYDRHGGLIRLNGDRVKTGCFFDFKGRKAFEEPRAILQFFINGEIMEVPADESLPPLVMAAKKMAEKSSDESDEESGTSSLIGVKPKRKSKKAEVED